MHYTKEVESLINKKRGVQSLQEKLLQEIKTGMYAEETKLPRETVLSKQMGVSRTQLRDVLAALEREGFISRRHGVGTVINKHVMQVKNRMDIEREFLDIIREHGYEPSVIALEVCEEIADKESALKLKIDEGTTVVCIRLLCGADGKPAIYAEDVFDRKLVREEYTDADYRVNIFQFLKQFCEVEPYLDLTEIHPAIADEKLAKKMNIPESTLLIKMEEVEYDVEGIPIFYSKQYFVDDLISHTVLRKKI